jgi:uncharacterized protein (TIGR02271 family)
MAVNDRDELNRQDLAPLDDMDDFEIADGDPDPRGWELITSDGREVGEVDELIVDRSAMKVRYLVCELDEEALGLDDADRHVLIPVGYARLDTDEKHVHVEELSSTQLAGLPAFTGDLTRDTDRDFEMARSSIGRTTAERDTGMSATGSARTTGLDTSRDTSRDGENRITRSEEELDISRRDVKAGEVRVDKHVETEHVEVPVTRRREEVEVERRPVDGMRTEGADIGEKHIRVPLHEERVDVNKRPVVKEEILVRKRNTQETDRVEADLRKERIDVETEGRVDEEGGRR